MTKTTMTMKMTNDLVFLGKKQPWFYAFLAEGWWVISMMMTTIKVDNDDDDNKEVFDKDV